MDNKNKVMFEKFDSANRNDAICVIDYGMGNLRSIEKKLMQVGAEVYISSDSVEILNAKKLILPGVGNFAKGVKNLKVLGIWDVLNAKVIEEKTPVLGICLGMQLMAKHSQEGDVKGLNWIDANVVKFQIKDTLTFKVPHIGWNSINVKRKSSLLSGLPKDASFYFVHSYHIICNNDNDVICTTEYEYEFTSAVQKNNIYGTQFHPEKSHDLGETIFRNFISL